MELNQLIYFRALAGSQSFTKAAADISISQSALSRSISKLEEELGAPLFLRGARTISLTPEGRRFLPYAERALRELSLGRQEIENSRASDGGCINLSFIHSLGSHILPRLLSDFRARHPRIRFNLDQDNSARLARYLLDGGSDLCLCSNLLHLEQIAWLYLYSEELFAVLPAGHPLARCQSLPLTALEDEPFITLKPDYSLRIISEQYFAVSRIHPSIIFEGDDVNTAASLVAARLGVSLLPKLSVLEEEKLAYIPVSFPICKRDIGLAWHSERPLSPPARKFQQFVIHAFGNTGP